VTRVALALGCALSVGALGCGGSGSDVDSGHVGPGMDGGSEVDAFHGGPQDVGPGLDGGCVPIFEICGDHVDQNCDGHDESCGDNDNDHFDACRPTDVDLTMCDCDDTRADTHPARGTVPGARELCDDYDNDCDGRIDESAQCCAGCASLGTELGRADACTAAGECDCLGEPGVGACPSGQTCCSDGCVDTTSDIHNCGACHSSCDASSDRCTASMCMCGTSGPCDGAQTCPAGTCM
jgi:hypothetical protein